MKHNIYFEYNKTSQYQKRLVLIKQSGFDGIFLKIDENENNKEIVSLARSLDLEIEALHLSADNCNSLWEEGVTGESYTNTIIEGIKEAFILKIPTVIMHISSGDNPPDKSTIGLKRIRKILEIANTYKIYLALENLRRLDYLDYILENIQDKYLKFCFDSGHANAFSKNIENFEFSKYQDLLICIHLSDNLGNHDSHLLPFDGNINWQKLMLNLKRIGFLGPLTLEAIKKDNLTEEQYLEKSKNVLKTLNQLYLEEEDNE